LVLTLRAELSVAFEEKKMTTNSTAQFHTMTGLGDETFPAGFESYRPSPDEEEEDEQNEDPRDDDEDDDEDEDENEDDQEEEEDNDEPDYSDAPEDEPSSFAAPRMFQNPIIFYRGYATQSELDQHRLSLVKSL
jgi:hypothetical protein